MRVILAGDHPNRLRVGSVQVAELALFVDFEELEPGQGLPGGVVILSVCEQHTFVSSTPTISTRRQVIGGAFFISRARKVWKGRKRKTNRIEAGIPRPIP
jgi:hypothetical protein